MSLLIESIKLLNGRFENLSYHEQRMHHSLTVLFGSSKQPRLEEFLQNSEYPKQGLYKCRVIYNDQFKNIEFAFYEPRVIRSLKRLENNTISYSHKLEDRHELNALFAKREQCDDILIVRNGMVTDTSYSNLAFKLDHHWITPNTFLLAGTMRQCLLDKGVIREQPVRVEDISKFSKFKLINAMLGFDGPEIDVSNIVE